MTRIMAIAVVCFVNYCARAEDPIPDPKGGPPEQVDPAKAKERIAQDAKEAGKRLAVKDPGTDTQQIQRNILENIDALIRKAQEPPPMSGGDSSTSSGMGGSSSQQPMPKSGGNSAGQKEKEKNDSAGGSTAQQQRRQRRSDRSEAATKPLGGQGALSERPELNGGGFAAKQPLNKTEPKNASMSRLPEVYKDIWGHLPEKMRQEMDLYFRDQFMPRYSELLRQYYSSLAERGGKSNP